MVRSMRAPTTPSVFSYCRGCSMPAPPGLNDAFTEEGYFWFEGNEDNQVAGTLSFDPINGVSLQLFGASRRPRGFV